MARRRRDVWSRLRERDVRTGARPHSQERAGWLASLSQAPPPPAAGAPSRKMEPGGSVAPPGGGGPSREIPSGAAPGTSEPAPRDPAEDLELDVAPELGTELPPPPPGVLIVED